MIADAANAATASVVELEPLLVSGSDAASLLGVSARQFRRLDAAGLVPMAIRLSASKRWSVRELTDWVASGAPSRQRWESMQVAAEADSSGRRRQGLNHGKPKLSLAATRPG